MSFHSIGLALRKQSILQVALLLTNDNLRESSELKKNPKPNKHN